VALAIAGAPDPGTTAVLRALDEEGASATFFVVGSRALRHPELVRAIHRGSHRMASGGFGDDPVAFRGPARLARDLRRTEQAVADATGEDVLARLYMAPQGVRGPATWAGARAAGYRLVAWTRAVWPDGLADARSAARVAVGGLEPGAVIAIGPAAADRPGGPAAAVRAVCAQARARGLEVAPLEEVTGLAPTGLTSRGTAAEEPVTCP
jgi:peptidoglycan/xylan/chitin deacetylase (PgdA/CDA1 family)